MRFILLFLTSWGFAGSKGLRVKEEVLAKSIFTPFFIRALEGQGDLNEDGYVTGMESGLYLSNNVINYSDRSQTPQYGKLKSVDYDQGDFVFAYHRHQPSPRPDFLTVTSAIWLSTLSAILGTWTAKRQGVYSLSNSQMINLV